ncbi:stage III sporulation protein AF [Mesobacillus maritimus]|uniref:stage III sporulation protein AF n=1 Tax=Mesobacillus maritimus TaxID=1643336 RepID=UPI002040ED2F|nr:stage III sporulation protein AF [Mesobacillus maritimus]MCM3586377.1 stage III sporulation protein AF [Mesobacillus maritimus]MCM3669591.1 stage III sporulation protein AF [Mesobacillus maritimus]
MDFLKEWITNIIIFILLATIIDMLLPNSNLQKYVKVVVSLLLISIILSPIIKIFTSDFETAIGSLSNVEGQVDQKEMENLIELQKKEIQASQHAYILEQTAVQLEKDAEEELMEKYGMEIAEIEIVAEKLDENLAPENLQSIMVEIVRQGEEDDAVAVVKEVKIDTSEPLPSKRESSQNTDEMITFLSEKWNVPKSTIEVIEGGTQSSDGQR